MSFNEFTNKLSVGEAFWVLNNEESMKIIHAELTELGFPETTPASTFSKHVGSANTKYAASLFGYSKFENPRNMSGIWPKIGFIYKKSSDDSLRKSDEQKIAEVQSRKYKWLVAILQGLNFPDEVNSCDIMIDGKVQHVNKVLPAMLSQGYEVKATRTKGKTVYIYRKKTASSNE